MPKPNPIALAGTASGSKSKPRPKKRTSVAKTTTSGVGTSIDEKCREERRKFFQGTEPVGASLDVLTRLEEERMQNYQAQVSSGVGRASVEIPCSKSISELEYMNRFMTEIIEIANMPSSKKYANYRDHLQPWKKLPGAPAAAAVRSEEEVEPALVDPNPTLSNILPPPASPPISAREMPAASARTGSSQDIIAGRRSQSSTVIRSPITSLTQIKITPNGIRYNSYVDLSTHRRRSQILQPNQPPTNFTLNNDPLGLTFNRAAELLDVRNKYQYGYSDNSLRSPDKKE